MSNQENVDADQLFLRGSTDAVLACEALTVSGFVLPRFQDLWRLSQSLDNRTRKLIRATFLFADFFVVDVVGVNAVFNRAQPRVVNFSACSFNPTWTSIITAPSNRPDGFARFCPARRGAEP